MIPQVLPSRHQHDIGTRAVIPSAISLATNVRVPTRRPQPATRSGSRRWRLRPTFALSLLKQDRTLISALTKNALPAKCEGVDGLRSWRSKQAHGSRTMPLIQRLVLGGLQLVLGPVCNPGSEQPGGAINGN